MAEAESAVVVLDKTNDVTLLNNKALTQLVLEQGLSDKLPDDWLDLTLNQKRALVNKILYGGEELSESTALEVVPDGSNSETVLFSLPPVDFDLIQTETEAVNLVKSLFGVGDFALYQLGGIFSKMSDMGWCMGHHDFKTCCDVEFDIQYRKVAYLMNIFRTMEEKSIPWSKVSSVGWTKLKTMVGILTPENVDEWVAKALSVNVTSLVAEVKNAKETLLSGEADNVTPIEDGVVLSTKTFTLHDDQKALLDSALNQVKLASGTEFDSVALELMCQQYLGEATAPEGIEATKLIDVYFTKVANTQEGLNMVINILDAYFPTVIVSLKVPDDWE
jgi:hypothetical protein